jgi:hypothetical protein
MEENFYKVQYKKENQRKKMAHRAVKERETIATGADRLKTIL